MDSVSNSLAGVDLSKLSDRDKQELQQFVMNESQKARIQACTFPLYTCPLPFSANSPSDPQPHLNSLHPSTTQDL
jgi:hypothetical protein